MDLRTAQISPPLFRAGAAVCTAAVAVFLLVQLTDWPPHEDETLALLVGRESLGDALHTVLTQRGGAPLHFLLAWLVAHAGGGLTELRIVSALLAVASVPVIALLAARLAGRTIALVATALVSASWILLFHGVYARMYSLFLLTSALSYLLLLRALERGRRRDWALWAIVLLLTVATHPYGALVFASQAAYVALTHRVRQALPAFAVVALVAAPFWRTDLVLAQRFDVGVGGGGARLGAPLSVLEYLGEVAGDFTAGWPAVLAVVLVLAALGIWQLARVRPDAALLAGCVFVVPALALTIARLGRSAAPESRHLIFALPFFSMAVAAGVVWLAMRERRIAPWIAVLGLCALLSAEVAWARRRTPPLFTGEPAARIAARDAASSWVAETARPDDVLFGFEPVYLGAWEQARRLSGTIVPRADAMLALKTLQKAPKPLGRGVWVFDGTDTTNEHAWHRIPARLPAPAGAFEARAFGPYLIIRTRRPTRTPARFLRLASQVMILGKDLHIGDADVNFVTVRRALARLHGYPPVTP